MVWEGALGSDACPTHPCFSESAPYTKAPEHPAGWDSNRRLTCLFWSRAGFHFPHHLRAWGQGTSVKGIHLTTGLWEPPGLGGEWPGIWRTLPEKWKHTCGPFEKVHPVLPAAREY